MSIEYTFEEMPIEHKRCSVNAHVPKRAYPSLAGYDLFAAERKVLKPWSRELIRLDLFIAITEAYYENIVGRSGLANVHGIAVHNGTIDLNYQGIVCVVLFSLPMKNMW